MSDVLTPADLKSLFGWTARLLLVRGERNEHQSGATATSRKGSASEPARPRQEPVKRALGGINKKALTDLEKLKRDLENKEKG